MQAPTYEQLVQAGEIIPAHEDENGNHRPAIVRGLVMNRATRRAVARGRKGQR